MEQKELGFEWSVWQENERKFRSANAKLQEAEQRADSAHGSSKGTTEQIETLKDEVKKKSKKKDTKAHVVF